MAYCEECRHNQLPSEPRGECDDLCDDCYRQVLARIEDPLYYASGLRVLHPHRGSEGEAYSALGLLFPTMSVKRKRELARDMAGR